jgi:nucleoside 2-deoxyribosyltransferase
MQTSRRKIYLAGGFRSGWQALVRKELPDDELLDPSLHNFQDPKTYTEWDLDAVRQSDVILANMEQSNPGGYALALEVGYAKALSKKIIFVDQVSDPTIGRYFEMVRQVSDVVFTDLHEALAYLKVNSDR